MNAAHIKYKQSEKGKATNKKYNHSDKGKKAMRRGKARYKGMKYNELCKNPYPKVIKVAYHHVNNTDVIPIPNSVHAANCGWGITHKQHIERINKWIKENYPIKNILERQSNCARCGKQFTILFPVLNFEVCTECCDKVRIELR